jgi:hypothetical protein
LVEEFEMPLELTNFAEQIFFATIRIEAQKSIGTGFLVGYIHPKQPNRGILTLVSCRHVLSDHAGIVTARLHMSQSPSNDLPLLGSQIPLGPLTPGDTYCGHPDPDVDVAAINISFALDAREDVFARWLQPEQFLNFEHPALLPGLEVFFVGYPIGLYDKKNNLPILRAGRIATIPKVDFEGRPEFLIDAHVHPGSSGSPVFVLLDNRYQCAGILGRSVTRKVPVESVPAADRQIIKDHIGLGVVYKPKAVLEVVKEAARRAADAL